MTSMNISLPDSMRTYIEAQVAQGGYSTASEYFRELIRQDQKRKASERLEAMLLEGLESGNPTAMTEENWMEIRQTSIQKRPQVIRDLIELATYIAEDNMDASDRFLVAAGETFKQLAQTPKMGKRCQFSHPNLIDVRQ
ncbi:MAG: type II toxin-antitoxin system ParD family antitoxin [Oscillatoriales cyanobacterium]|nr:MAG: type II toxin-antitoxin system ParD family antitoxin [Oscillatoriales cyanobacterium]